jgi:hypothetical protein
VPVTWQTDIIFTLFHSACAPCTNVSLSVISGFCHKADEHCTLLDYYTASSANLLLTCQHKLPVPSLGVKNPKDMMGTIYCPKMLVRNYHYMLHNDTEERSSKLLLKFSSHLTKNTHCPDLKNSLSNLSSQLTGKIFSCKSIITMGIQTWHHQLQWQPVSFHLISHMSHL